MKYYKKSDIWQEDLVNFPFSVKISSSSFLNMLISSSGYHIDKNDKTTIVHKSGADNFRSTEVDGYLDKMLYIWPNT